MYNNTVAIAMVDDLTGIALCNSDESIKNNVKQTSSSKVRRLRDKYGKENANGCILERSSAKQNM